MKRAIIFTFLLLMVACQPEINVIISKEPGMISGVVVPTDVAATVELYQGTLVAETVTDAEGVFVFADVDPGTYRLVAKAANYGSVEISKIKVSDSEGYDAGVIELALFPTPLVDVYPYNGARDVNILNIYIRLYFNDYILPESLEEAFRITPDIENLSFTHPNYNARSSGYQYSIYGIFQPGTEYTVTIDTSAETIHGKHLEFPYSSSFIVEKFKVTYIGWTGGSYADLRIVFNAAVAPENLDKIIIDPPTPVHLQVRAESRASVSNSETRFSIFPEISWMTDTTYTVLISGEIAEASGVMLGRDSVFTFTTEPIQIIENYPRNNQYFIGLLPDIKVRFNNIVDESTIEAALSVVPEAVYEIWTYYGNGYNYFFLNVTEALTTKTEYTVTLSTDLKDYYGRNLKTPYVFSFVTQ
ncbi:MAG TPA: hypothetical protein ENN20_10805 [Candidatus Marinimicrobia bacterium]|nr:hypothetical protein [Candidatus Neomarinimicrobiota bacterium]